MTALSFAEVLDFPVRFLAELPIPMTLTVRRIGGHAATFEKVIRFTTSRIVAAEAIDARACAITPNEYEALAEALADGCLRAESGRAEIDRRRVAAARGEPYRIVRQRLLGAVRHPDRLGRHGWTWRELFDALALELVVVEMHEPRVPGRDVAVGEAAE